MSGGEIFIPKIASMEVTEMAKAIAPNLPQKIIGIRPGEKLHEIMCSVDDSYLTLEFDDYYVIKPTITFTQKRDFHINLLGEAGRNVPQSFEYNSENNDKWLTHKQLISIIREF